MQGKCGEAGKLIVPALESQGFKPANIFLNQNEDVVGNGMGRHVFTTVGTPKGPFIVDTTTSQFPEIPGFDLWNRTRADLIQNGYTRLTPEVAQAYAVGVSRPGAQLGLVRPADFMKPQFARPQWPDVNMRWQ